MSEERRNYWFPAKRYGWGWSLPSTWQGWLVVVLYGVLLMGGALLEPLHEHHGAFLAYVIVLTGALVAIIVVKGERRPRWRWGDDEPPPRS